MIQLELTLKSGEFVYDKKLLKQALRTAGKLVQTGAQARLRAKIGGGRLYRGSGGGARYRGYKAGHYEASLAGEAPVSVTDTLAKSIKVLPFKSGEGVAIRDVMFYGLFLEAGAEGGVASGNTGKSKLGKRKKGEALTGLQGQANTYKRGVLQSVAGTRILAPRPFLSAELDHDSSAIDTKLRAAVLSGIGWKTP